MWLVQFYKFTCNITASKSLCDVARIEHRSCKESGTLVPAHFDYNIRASNGSGGHAVQHPNVSLGDGGSILPAAVSKL